MIEFTEELYEKYNKLLWNRVGKKLAQQDKNVTWRVTPEDLHSEAVVAMANACEKFEPERGFKFSTYLTIVVDNQLNCYLRTFARPFSISQSQNKRVRYIIQELQKGRTVKDLSKELNLSETDILEYKNMNLNAYSTDFVIDGGDKSDMQFDIGNQFDEEESQLSDEIELMYQVIDDCDIVSEEDKIQYYRYKGIRGYKKDTILKLAKEKGISAFRYRNYILEVASILEFKIKQAISRYRD